MLILPNISGSKGNHTIKFSQATEYNKIGLFLQNTCRLPNHTKSKIFGDAVFEMKSVDLAGLIFKYYLEFTIIKDKPRYI